MKRLFAIAIGATLALTLGSPAGATPVASIVGVPAWGRVASIGKGLRGVVSFGASDVWAVGVSGSPQGRTLAEHWNGSSFSRVPTPNRSGRSNILEDVAGVASSDVWAVGHADVLATGAASTLAEHWDGITWQIVPTPNEGTKSTTNVLTGVAAIAANDAWAVGTSTSWPQGPLALTLHWNGSVWSRVRNSCGQGLSDVTAVSSTDVWAVGGGDTCHWNGSAWSRVPAAPDISGFTVLLQDVTAVSAHDLWAVGLADYACGESECSTGEIQHWSGGLWHFVTHAVPALYGVDAVTADDIWAVGLEFGPAIEHFDGATWSQVPSGVGGGELLAIAASGPSDLWAAGDLGSDMSGALVEQAPSATAGAVTGTTHVAGATVSWFGPDSGSVATDPIAGGYQVGGLAPGTYLFTATYAGCTPASAQVTVIAGTTVGRNFHLNCG
jgi:hypothetical protein